ncbi:hypothetical protein ElyMa_000966100 [Elysia marginata]|uniref:Uncharacterized protein n=1 Tax=Elysia marginata TaxID=1093978 RepID=A0AAV4HDT9_9GAST|nr:hypothetical protein ElyMa_000966100 [Elysia marginata]
MLFRQSAKSSLGWQPEGVRIVSAMFKTNKKRLTFGSLIVKKIKHKLRRGKFAPHQRLIYNFNLLSSPQKREEYGMELSNMFYALETPGDVEDIEGYSN